MRATLVSMLIVALLSAGICLLSVTLIGNVSSQMEQLRTDVLELIEQGDVDNAQQKLGQMKELWSDHEDTLAILAPHDALHEITGLILEGKANLEADDLDDFNRSMALLGEALDHLHAEEQLRLSNILWVC